MLTICLLFCRANDKPYLGNECSVFFNNTINFKVFYTRLTSDFKTMNKNGLYIFDLNKNDEQFHVYIDSFVYFFSMSNYM